jgi:hypothetical protein
MQSSLQYLEKVAARLAAMSDFEIAAALLVAVVLIGFLCIKRLQRLPGDSRSFNTPEVTLKSSQWTEPTDLLKLKRTLERLRMDYLIAHRSAKGVLFHRSLMRLTQQAVARSGYFQGREPEDELRLHQESESPH